MKIDILKNFKTIDTQVFTNVMRQMGFTAAACYRSIDEKLVLILKTEQEKSLEWSVVVPCNIHYTPSQDENAHGGWVKASEVQTDKDFWKKSVYLYFPEQLLFDEKMVFAVTCSPGKRLKGGELDGMMEAMASRLRGWLMRDGELTKVHENYMRERVAEMDSDIRSLVDHELRTPLAALSGYLSILKDIQGVSDSQAHQEYWHIVDSKLVQVIDAIDRLSMALHGKKGRDADRMTGIVNVRQIVGELTEHLLTNAVEHVAEDVAKKLNVHTTQAEDTDCVIEAEEKMFRWATWEVLKNAIVYSRSGKVDIAVYMVNENVIIDIIDDGAGVSPGTEELIFLRFFQEPGKQRSKKGKRGLGLGLYLARQIVQRHMGELLYLRTKNSTIFRFIWPGLQMVRKVDEKRGA